METPKTKKDWLVFFIKYSSAILVLLGALWNYAEVGYNAVTGTNAAIRLEKEKQLQLWQKNKECLKQSPQRFETDKREVIQLLLCEKTATLLVEVIPPDISLATAKWIELARSEKSASIFELGAADVKRVNQGSVVVELCRYTDKNYLHIVRKVNNHCVLESREFVSGIKRIQNVPCNFCNGL